MEETFLTGNDLMTGRPSPVIPEELFKDVVAGVDSCASTFRALFECLQRNEVEPFCQVDIVNARKCAGERDKVLRTKLLLAERNYGQLLSNEELQQRISEMEAREDRLGRLMVLASGMSGIDGFQARWRLHGESEDLKARIAVAREVSDERSKKEGRQWWKIF